MKPTTPCVQLTGFCLVLTAFRFPLPPSLL